MEPSLFDLTQEPPPLAARLKPRLRALADRGVYFGTSSWKYPGWMGSIYSRERYFTRNKFSTQKFESECIKEYAETFPVAGGDFSFYKIPDAAYWDKVFAGTPEGFGFGLKVPEHFTVGKWPEHDRYGKHAGQRNELFLDAGHFANAFLKPLLPHKDKVAVLMFEFGAFSKAVFGKPGEFRERLSPFLEALPSGWNYGIEIRNEDYLQPEYFSLLAKHNVAHVLNAWTKMPALSEQIEIPNVYTADFTVVRALLRKGRSYEQAVQRFEPYKRVQEPDPETRQAVRRLAERSITEQLRAYLFVILQRAGRPPGAAAIVADHTSRTLLQ